MPNNPEFASGSLVAAAFGKKYSHSKIERMVLVVKRKHPDGYFTIVKESGPKQIPVHVIPVGSFVRHDLLDRKREELPNPRKALEESGNIWSNFTPVEGFKICLPESVQQQ